MISVEEALKIIRNNIPVLSPEEQPVLTAFGRVLSRDISAPISMPPFDQSAMDGYACRIGDVQKERYKVIGEVKAGDNIKYHLQEGEAVRIFTGACVPESASFVVMQEKTEKEGKIVRVEGKHSPGQNIRKKGEQISAGDLALKKGTCLNPGTIGFLTDLGVTSVEVFKKPGISLLVTGNELVEPGGKLEKGQIYESNSSTLKAAVNSTGFSVTSVERLKDDLKQTREALQKRAEVSNVLIISGGISVGNYDFVGKALEQLGAETFFYKISQKPGKPTFFGKLGSAFIFALPGNPAAALTTYYLYAFPALRKMAGYGFQGLERRRLKITAPFKKKGDRAQFLKSRVSGDKVEVLQGQSSAMLSSFALANALTYIPADLNEVTAGSNVEVLMLPPCY